MNFKTVAAVITFVAASTAALATPQYLGNTTAPSDWATYTPGQDLTPGFDYDNHWKIDNNTSGFYLWNDEEATRNWSMRWTSPTATSNPTWFGSIRFVDRNLGGVQEFAFNAGDTSTVVDIPGFLQFVTFSASTNTTGHFDGLNFQLNSDYELLEFTLGSSMFNDTPNIYDGLAGAAANVFIGSEYNNPLALAIYNDHFGAFEYRFEIPVIEPGSLALLGLGLAGLAASRRRQKNLVA